MAVFTNQAQLSYNDSIKNSNIAVGEILEVLSATKTAVREEYGQNDSVTYVVSLVNSGTTALNGLTLTDNLGEYPFGAGTLVPLLPPREQMQAVLAAAPWVCTPQRNSVWRSGS